MTSSHCPLFRLSLGPPTLTPPLQTTHYDITTFPGDTIVHLAHISALPVHSHNTHFRWSPAANIRTATHTTSYMFRCLLQVCQSYLRLTYTRLPSADSCVQTSVSQHTLITTTINLDSHSNICCPPHPFVCGIYN